MNALEFEVFLKNWQENERSVLVKKAEEYAEDEDRFHNFNILAEITGLPRVQVASVLMLKNFMSFLDAVRRGDTITEEFADEKLGDTRNYIALTRGMIMEDNDSRQMDLSYRPNEER